MDIFIKVVQFLLSLSLLVLFHELGHFIFAKIFKTRVEKFYLFFDPWFSLFKFKKGETEYGIGWLPLGGYVKIAGMIDESMDKEQMKQPAEPWEFRSKPAWQRLLIMIGGVTVNVILAFVIYTCVMFTYGETYLPTKNVANGVEVGSIFKEIGLKNGDKILGTDNNEIVSFSDIIPNILMDKPSSIQIIRNGAPMSIDVPSEISEKLLVAASSREGVAALLRPRVVVNDIEIKQFTDVSSAYDAGMRDGDKIISINNVTFNYYDEFTGVLANNRNTEVNAKVLRANDTLMFKVPVDDSGVLGIYVALPSQDLELATKHYSFFAAIPAGVSKGVNQISSYLKQLKLLFSNGKQATKSVGGFASIANIFPSSWNWESFWNLTAFISIMLAVMNILPIPALDGGHVMFLLYEVVSRRKPSDKFMEYTQTAGMILLLGLFVLANVNDILKFLF